MAASGHSRPSFGHRHPWDFKGVVHSLPPPSDVSANGQFRLQIQEVAQLRRFLRK